MKRYARHSSFIAWRKPLLSHWRMILKATLDTDQTGQAPDNSADSSLNRNFSLFGESSSTYFLSAFIGRYLVFSVSKCSFQNDKCGHPVLCGLEYSILPGIVNHRCRVFSGDGAATEPGHIRPRRPGRVRPAWPCRDHDPRASGCRSNRCLTRGSWKLPG